MEEPFLVNPAKKKGRKRKVGRPKSRRVAAPRKKRKALPRGKRHRPVVYGSGKVWTRSSSSRSKRRGISLNPYLITAGNPPKRKRSRSRKRYRRNPAGGQNILGLKAFQRNIPYFITGGVSAITTTMAPAMMSRVAPGISSQFPIAFRLGSQVAVAGVGAFAMNMMIPRNKMHGTVWMIVSGATIAADLIREFVLPQLGLSDYDEMNYVSDYEINDNDADLLEEEAYDEIGDNGDNDGMNVNEGYEELNAFPDTLSAFPTELSAYTEEAAY